MVNNKIIKSLGVLAILAFGVIFTPTHAYAQVCSYSGNVQVCGGSVPFSQSSYVDYPMKGNNYGGYSSGGYSGPTMYSSPIVYSNPAPVTYVVPAPAPNYSNAPTINSGTPVASTSTPKKATVAKVAPKTSTLDPNGYVLVPKSQLLALNASQIASLTGTPATGDNLTANALFGQNGFMPTGILGWILLAILILLIVILVRVVFGRRKQFLATPLKHD